MCRRPGRVAAPGFFMLGEAPARARTAENREMHMKNLELLKQRLDALERAHACPPAVHNLIVEPGVREEEVHKWLQVMTAKGEIKDVDWVLIHQIVEPPPRED
jgi:hypothetical protein